ncbi:hypothetical protein BS50DRAFT_53672 [Corynespora cassiicola Philippines]|uniref:Uncharacterized protein n=1 Tax=Corynespora cassiicola Philippines TaxID=1448308 RepID=A0A2T2NIZ7_CORCC|nr:hypothetical protein BS50DRAFT_53672 [Corynespora cassiicola Philippines]
MNYLLLIALLTSPLTRAQSYEVATESETSTTYELAARAGQPDHQTRAHMLSAGECWQFRDKMDDWSTCEPHCGYKMGEGPMGCSAVLGSEYYRFTNDAGEYYNPGRCLCRHDGLDFVEAILGVVLEGLAEFGKFTCEWILPAISLTIDVGLNFVPGGAASNIALKSSIRVAKYLDRNGYGADAFGSWYV